MLTLIYLALVVLMLVSGWKVFEKAGKPGWAYIIPIYNLVVWLEIIKKPVWWIIMLFIPLVNIYFAVVMMLETAKCFGKSSGFGIGLVFLPFIFLPMLAFQNDAVYTEPAGETGASDPFQAPAENK